MKEQAYTLHRPARRHFVRIKNDAAGIDVQREADLADMQTLSRQNQGQRYILTVIDVFSKFAWVTPVKSKDASSISDAFERCSMKRNLGNHGRLQTDKGKKSFNKDFTTLMKNMVFGTSLARVT